MESVPSRPETASERLAKELESKGHTELAQRAREGVYDDFRSPLAFPKIALVKDLLSVHEHDMALRAKAGEWDGSQEEAILWLQSEDAAQLLEEGGE